MIKLIHTSMVSIKNQLTIKYKFKIINQTKEIVEDTFIRDIFRLSETAFSRVRKISFPNLIYYSLAKKGITSKMEAHDFNQYVDCKDISSTAIFKQREKYSAEIFRYILFQNLKTFYEEYQDDVKLFKGYVLAAVDGSSFEIPNTKSTRETYRSQRHHSSVARAHVSVFFDALNHYVMDAELGTEKANEKKQQITSLSRLKELELPFPIIRVMDRGYVSIRDMYYSNLNNDKFVVRLRYVDFNQELKSTSSKDKTFDIKLDPSRWGSYRKNDPEFFRLMSSRAKDQLLSTRVRIVKIELPGTAEAEYLATNLSEEEFTRDDLKAIYHLRWEVETNFHTLKESLKIEAITSSKPNLINQDILSQMVVFNMMQAFISDSDEKIDQNKYLYHMQTNRNMAAGFMKQYLILAIVSKSSKKRTQYMNKLANSIDKFIEPIRPGRNYERKKDKKNRYSITKRKAF